jgi:ribosome-associated protein
MKTRMTESLCKTCEHMREVTSGNGSRFLLCRLSQTDQRFPKYPPQPVVRCEGFGKNNEEGQIVTRDYSIPKPNALCLDQFLKLSSIAESGGQAKVMIQSGQVKVNGESETRRRRKLVAGDVVEVAGDKLLVKDSVSSK